MLESAGLAIYHGAGFPLAHRHLLIASVLEFVSSPAFANYLRENGHDVSSKIASNWQQATRDWLGLPPAGRGKPSAEYRKTVVEWRQANGNPTLDEIDAGWVPAHRRRRDLSIKEHIEEFRQMLACFDEIGQHDEVERRLAELMKTRIETAPFKIEDQGPTDGVPPPPDPTDKVPPPPVPTDEVPPPPDPTDKVPPPPVPTDEVPPPPDPEPTHEVSPPPDPALTDEVPPTPAPDPIDEVPPPPEGRANEVQSPPLV